MKATARIIERDKLFTKAEWIQDELDRIGNKLKDNGIIPSYTAYGTCGAFDLDHRDVGKNLKGIYYGVSSDMSVNPNFRVCVPLIADQEYFYYLEDLLIKNLR